MLPKLENIPKNLLRINYDLDYEYLLDRAYKAERKQFYHHGRKEERIEGYTYSHYKDESLKYLVSKYGLDIKGKYNMKFVYIAPNTILDWHTDWGTKCAFNWILNDNEACIQYKNDRPYVYKSAIINTSAEHKVENINKERILFKISVFEQDYLETCKKFITRFS